MYPLYFYVCWLASVAVLTGLILLAIFPVNLPIVAKSVKSTRSVARTHKPRAPTRRTQSISYWEPPWEDDDDDL